MINRSQINRRLQSTLGFSEEDLIVNRAGRLTTHQRQRVLDSALKRIETEVGFLAVALVIYALLPVPRIPDLWLVGIVVATLWWEGMKGHQAWRQFQEGKIAMLEGVVVMDKEVFGNEEGASSTKFYLRISGETFKVGRGLFDCFVEGYRYRIFFTAYGKRIISAELLD